MNHNMTYNFQNLHNSLPSQGYYAALSCSQQETSSFLPVTFVRKGTHTVPVLDTPAQCRQGFITSSVENKVYNTDDALQASPWWNSYAPKSQRMSPAESEFAPFRKDTGYMIENFSNLNEISKSLNQINQSYESHDVGTRGTENSPYQPCRVIQLGGDVIEQAQVLGQKEFLIDEKIPILEGYQYALSYMASKGPRRRKRVIHCKYPGCNKHFIKAWNFLDHARMHRGEKPFC